MRDQFFRFLAATCLALFVASAGAADIKIGGQFLSPGVVLEGTVEPGDYNKLRKLIDENCPSESWDSSMCPGSIYLASPGGSLTESMKIGRLIRALRLRTEIACDDADLRQIIVGKLKLRDPENNYLCASACFFMAIAGIDRDVGLGPGCKGILGIHRPYMSDTDLKTLSADQALASATQLRTIIELYLKEMSVPIKYADSMFSIPKDQVQWISEADLESGFAGLIPELKDWMNARCDKRTDVEKRLEDVFDAKVNRGEHITPEELSIRGMLDQKDKVQAECEGMIEATLREDAWKAYRGH